MKGNFEEENSPFRPGPDRLKGCGIKRAEYAKEIGKPFFEEKMFK